MSLIRKTESIYDEPITAVLTEMREYGPTAPEYPELVKRLEDLSRLREEMRRSRMPKPDTILGVLGNLVGIVAIVAYEQKHVFNSKGLNFVRPNPT